MKSGFVLIGALLTSMMHVLLPLAADVPLQDCFEGRMLIRLFNQIAGVTKRREEEEKRLLELTSAVNKTITTTVNKTIIKNLHNAVDLAVAAAIEKEIQRIPSSKKEKGSRSVEFFDESRFEAMAADVRILVHHGDSTRGSGHIWHQWRNAFLEAGVPFILLIRQDNIYGDLRSAFPDDPIVLAPGNQNMPALIARLPNLKAVFYTGNTGNIVNMLVFDHVKHIFIGHGDSDKAASATRVFRAYDEVWVAGQAHIDRLKTVGVNDSCVVVGRPQTKTMLDATPSPMSACYLPTWEGPNEANMYCSLQHSGDIVRLLQEMGLTVSAKLHPNTGARLRNRSFLEREISESGAALIEIHSPIMQVMRDARIEASEYLVSSAATQSDEFIRRVREAAGVA